MGDAFTKIVDATNSAESTAASEMVSFAMIDIFFNVRNLQFRFV